MQGRNDQPFHHIGTSGWHYDHWRQRFYPPGLAKPKWLDYYARTFATVEINASFYRLPTENAYRNWYAQTPPGFLFAVKGSRLITHYRRLRDVGEALSAFYARATILGEKLGAVLYQLPPDLQRDDELLSGFLAQLPAGIRHAVEFRHESWFAPPVYETLARHDAALCVVDLPDFNCPRVATAPFLYLRFHGAAGKYWGAYGEEGIDYWAEEVKRLGAGRGRVFAYFNNDAEAQAVQDARLLAARLVATRDTTG
jgi:uncharacterized protein YecE (DUF72 family)